MMRPTRSLIARPVRPRKTPIEMEEPMSALEELDRRISHLDARIKTWHVTEVASAEEELRARRSRRQDDLELMAEWIIIRDAMRRGWELGPYQVTDDRDEVCTSIKRPRG